MHECSGPDIGPLDPAANLVGSVFRNAAEAPDGPALVRRDDAGWTPMSAKEFADEVARLAGGLLAAGIGAGDRVGLLSRTRLEWTLCDYAIWAAGAVSVPVYETSSADQAEWILSDSGAVAVVVESDQHAALVAGVRGRLPDLRTVWSMDGGDLRRLAADGSRGDPAEVADRRRTVRASDLATIIYTSGTTGRPKGCELTHANLLGAATAAAQVLPELFNPDGSTLLFLPLAHVFGRIIQCACVENRVRMGHTADIANLVPDLMSFQPTFVLSVPRVFEKIFNTAAAIARSAPAESSPLPDFDRAVEVAVAYSEALQERGEVPAELAAEHRRHDEAVYSKIRTFLGGRLRYAVSGGAPLVARLGHFYRGAGLTVLEGYGLTETTAAGTVNTPDHLRIGTVGRPIPGGTVRIADDGEILLAGPHLFRGYHKADDATAEAVTGGFLHTGDLGALDDDGFLSITGRKKDIIVTAGGKNVAPAALEDRLRAHPLIGECLVVGDGRPFVGCLLTLDEEALPGWRREHGRPDDTPLDELAADPELLADIQAAVDDANRSVSQAESIRRFRILTAELSEASGHLTPTLKVKRNVMYRDFAAEIEALYG